MKPYSLRDRAKETSSWLGLLLFGVALYLAYKLDPTDSARFLVPLLASFGGLGIAIPDRGTVTDLSALAKLLAAGVPATGASPAWALSVMGDLLKVVQDSGALPNAGDAAPVPTTAQFGAATITPKPGEAGFTVRGALGVVCAIGLLGLVLGALSGCTSVGNQMQGNRFPSDAGCGGVNVTAGGGGQLALMPPGATGEIDVTSTGCTVKYTGWVFAPWQASVAGVSGTPAAPPAPLPPAAPAFVEPTPPTAPVVPAMPAAR